MYFHILLWAVTVRMSNGNDYDKVRKHHQELREHLLTTNHRNVPPADSVQIDVDFRLLYIKSLDVTSQLLTMLVAMDYKWVDPLLVWNESEPFAPRVLFMDEGSIWTPNILATNNDGDVTLQPGKDGIRVYSNGNVGMMIFQKLQTQCYVDVTRYPFDDQYCKLTLTSWGFKYSLPKIVRLGRDRELGNSVEWQLVKIRTSLDTLQGFTTGNIAVIDLHLRREYMFYLLTVIIPVFLLSIMNACVFLLPVESGEKISYLISILVTYSVFINFTNEVMPKSGTPSHLGIYLVLVLCESCAAILVTLGVLNAHHKGSKQGCSQHKLPDDVPEPGNASSPEKAQTLITVKSARRIHPTERQFFLIFMVFSLLSPIIFFL